MPFSTSDDLVADELEKAILAAHGHDESWQDFLQRKLEEIYKGQQVPKSLLTNFEFQVALETSYACPQPKYRL